MVEKSQLASRPGAEIVEPSTGDGAGLPPDPFPHGPVKAGLERLRARLLDLTNRNRLINFRHTKASSLRVVNTDMAAVFSRLTSGTKLTFEPVPEPPPYYLEAAALEEEDESVEPGKPSPEAYAAELGWDTSFDLKLRAPLDEAPTLPVLHYHERLETISRKIGTAAKTSIEESGTNMLFLVFGFLEYFESDTSQQTRLAPLLTVPVNLERTLGANGLYNCTLEQLGDDPINNLSLAELMRKDFGVEIPAVEENDTPDEYFARFAPILELKPRWKIRRQITLTLLSFGKFLMYRDLDPEAYPAICRHILVRDLFEGSRQEATSRADEYDIDAQPHKESVPLILDADSSQHSALIDALKGRNLVIEGPPGTGKSQTITNLIAAALANGKTVLFVAEKLAALEVVRRRLDDSGLGMFCLELHSHKTKKQTLISELQDRLAARGGFREPHDLKNQLAIVEDSKRRLLRYIELMQEQVPGFDCSVFEALWAREKALLELPFSGEIKGSIPNITKINRAAFLKKRQALHVYAEHLSSILQSHVSLDKHPWRWIQKPIDFDKVEEVESLVTGLLNALSGIRAHLDQLSGVCGLKIAFNARSIDEASPYLYALPEVPEHVDNDLVASCHQEGDRDALRKLHASLACAQNAKTQLLDVAGLAVLGFDWANLEQLEKVHETVNDLGLSGVTLSRLKKILNVGDNLQESLANLQTSFDQLDSVFDLHTPRNGKGASFLLAFAHLLAAAPIEDLHFRTETLEADGACAIAREAIQEAIALQREQDAFNPTVDISLARERYSPSELDEFAIQMEEAGLFSRLFGRDYKQAKRVYRKLIRSQERVGRATAAGALRELAQHNRRHHAFVGNASYKRVLGVHFDGLDSNWKALSSIIDWYEAVFTKLPEHIDATAHFRNMLLRSRAERLKNLRSLEAEFTPHIEHLERMHDFLPLIQVIMPATLIDELETAKLLEGVRTRIASVRSVATQIERLEIDEEQPLKVLATVISHHRDYLKALQQIELNKTAILLLGNVYKGIDTDPEPIHAALELTDSVFASTLPRALADWLLSAEFGTRVEWLRTTLRETFALRVQIQKQSEALDSIAGSAFDKSFGREDLGVPEQTLVTSLKALDHLEGWSQLLRAKLDARRAGLEKFTAMGEAGSIAPDHLVLGLDYLLHNSICQSILDQNPELASFSGRTHEQVRSQFAAADKMSIQLHREAIAVKIDRRGPPAGIRGGQVKSLTEMALITHVVHHPQSRVKIRQLVSRAGRALQALKPCFMMGPLSVAQYLAHGDLKFDLVVMDEASQLRPEDAVGAMSRGTQVVIVGDPMQLPPTNFFQRVTQPGNGEDADYTVVDEGESILDVASTIYQPLRRLRWHYRSRHQSLIAVSNSLFYKDLIIFPSAYDQKDGLGVKYHSVSNGVCDQGRNPREAEEIVGAILDHMKEHPDQSLGVVALNLEQSDLIEELLDKRLRLDPFAATYQERMNSGTEPFFIKNLENVQGDERDVIFISATYGRDSNGNFFQRFGPINGPNGHRRLNVLFTRAKMRVEVFSSIDPGMIRVEATSRQGLEAFKTYLTYAQTGILTQQTYGDDSQPTNDFETSVGRILTEAGYSVAPQVGVAGFFIDLAIKHPTQPGKFLLGIECDGATYHSGRSARDRDRLRQEILVNLGWKIHRIWSTDWFKNRAAEKRRLLSKVSALLGADPLHRAVVSQADRAKALRQELCKLRDSEILIAFPDTPTRMSILRDDMLDRFVARRPKTKNDWFRIFPPDVRTSLDSRQVGRYLDRILEIIGSMDPSAEA